MKPIISRENLERYYRLSREWGAGFVRLLEPRSAGRFRNEPTALSDEETRILENFYLDTRRNPTWKGYPIVSYPGYNQRRYGCRGAGDRFLFIDSRGIFKPCPFCDTPYGSALTVPFADAVTQMSRTGCHKIAAHG